MKSIDGGYTWTILENGLPLDFGAEQLFMSPTNSNVLYVKEYDGGLNWQEVNVYKDDNSITVENAFMDENTLYVYSAGKGFGIYTSTDNGNTWNPLTEIPTAIEELDGIDIFLDSNKNLYISESDFGLFTNKNVSINNVYPNNYTGSDIIITSSVDVDTPTTDTTTQNTDKATSGNAALVLQMPTSGGDVSGVYRGNSQTLKNDFAVKRNSSISNIKVASKVDNEGLLSNMHINEGGEIKGGKLTGFITNEGTIRDFTFVGAKLEGGKLAGKVYNNSQVGGRIIDVEFEAGSQMTGGILEGKIQGDCTKPVLIKNATIKSGSELSCVKLGEDVIVEEDVTVK